MTKLRCIKKIPDYAVIIRAIHERGATQTQALEALKARGLWLSDEQKEQAGFSREWRIEAATAWGHAWRVCRFIGDRQRDVWGYYADRETAESALERARCEANA